MDRSTDQLIERWRSSGVIDAATAERIRAWERAHATPQGSRFARFAFGFGGLLLGAGVLLFVAANWPQMSPFARMATLVGTVALLHVAGGLAASRSAALATTLHAVGTGAFGGAVFLAGQVFNLEEHWPLGLLVWAIGAAVALLVRRDWPHVIWVALLVPAWLVGEWQAGFRSSYLGLVPILGLFMLALAYLAAVGPGRDAPWRRALARLGAIALVPIAVMLQFGLVQRPEVSWSAGFASVGWVVAIVLPLALGVSLRGRAAWPLLVGLAFAIAVTGLDDDRSTHRLLVHLLYAGASAGLVAWGLRDSHALRVNLGVLGFALSVLWFYYDSLFDRLGRSLGLVVLGVLFIGGGWWLERARRRLLGRIGAVDP
jgi:uncharacterized membrane protein